MFGAELSLGNGARTEEPDPPGPHLLVLARGPEGYRRLSRQLASAHLAGGEKGKPRYDFDALTEAAGGHWHILTGCRKGHVRQALSEGGPEAAAAALADLVDRFGRDRVSIELTHHGHPLDDERNAALADLAPRFGVGSIATTAAHFAEPSRGRLAMAMGAIRARHSMDEAAGWLAPLGGSHLRSGEEMARLFAHRPEVVTAAAELGEQCAFGLALIAPQLPPFDVPAGHTEDSWLRHLVMAGARNRYGPPERAPRAYAQIEHELEVIARLQFPGYFLVVHDITRFCRENNILCQGRGSAANSAVCYALGVTNVDPIANELLFERFLSPARDGPPDIDIDIESDLREKAIQYVYDRYGRDYAAQVANVITYRGRSAVRDMARALGFSQGQQDAWSKQISRWNGLADSPDVEDIPEQVIDLALQIHNLPRHMGIHSGGMVICDRPIADVCPVEWARMENRSVLQWDKDDCAAIGLVKFDLLGLGMLSALHYAIDLVAEHKGIEVDLAKLDLSEPAVYEMLQRADSVGVFQVESRAQMATLPRLKPRVFYDLVVEVALIRPGPIQGGSVHPYIRRRNGLDPVTYDHPSMESGAAEDVGGAAVSGTAHAAGGRLRGLLRRRGRPVAPGDGLQALDRADAAAAWPVLRRHARTARHHRRGGRPDLREAGSLRQFRLPGEPFAVLRVAGVLFVVVQAAPSGGVLRRAAAGAADGLLLAAVAGGRRPQARRHRARARRQRQPGARHAGERRARGAARPGQCPPHRRRAGRAARRRAKSQRAVHIPAGSDRTAAAERAADRGAGHRRCAGLLRDHPSRGAVGGRRGRHPAPGPVAGSGVVIAYPVAARHDRTGAGRRRRVGHRHFTGQLSHAVPAGGPGRHGRGPRRPAACRCPTEPGCWWPGR